MNLIHQLKQIPDLRGTRGKRYQLWQLLFLALLGSLCGYVGYRPLSAFCRENRGELEAVLALPEGAPTPALLNLSPGCLWRSNTLTLQRYLMLGVMPLCAQPQGCGLAAMAKVFDAPAAMMAVIHQHRKSI